MTPERHAQIKEVFVTACPLEGDQRRAYLEEACDGDPGLREQVERLLRYHHGDSGEPFAPEDMTTTSAGAPASALQDSASDAEALPEHPGGNEDERAFQPGTVVGDRYRIVALLGKGGMGEVFRAEDLKLNQTVALKFLPKNLATNPVWLTRLVNEVRVARQVTHPNVCRVYDIGDADGDHYLSMEYIDGEDLRSLLKRIGRLPRDKAVEIARQLCAGLAAAHAKGVLHRDLKPANVMIDGRGQVRITDFGLAGLAGQIERSDFRAGTPAYMAPEQLAGKDVSVKSDLYALGLVLYELFTGRPAFEARSFQEYARMHQSSDPSAPSSIVNHIDPAVERVILHCLEKDPARRPESTIAVAGALPGGDPLAAALAAGETPTPEMIAAAGTGQSITSPILAGCLVAFVALLVTLITLSQKFTALTLGGLDKAPAVLAEQAREIAQRARSSEVPPHSAHAFAEYSEYQLNAIVDDGWDRLLRRANSDLVFWYRQAAEPLVPVDVRNVVMRGGRITPNDPRPNRPGMSSVVLDPFGRLLLFEAVPSIDGQPIPQSGGVDWSEFFALAGLEERQFEETAAGAIVYGYAGGRRAWTGLHPEREGVQLRVEAASHRGRTIYFAVLERSADRPEAPFFSATGRLKVSRHVLAFTVALLVLAAIPLAWRNMQHGYGDRRGAFRLGVFVFALCLAIWVLQARHGPDFQTEMKLLPVAIASALLEAVLLWLFYVALEPYVRRFWPQIFISWSRLLAGRFRDPQVGRSVLYGSVLGAFWGLAMTLGQLGRGTSGGIRGTPMRSASLADPLIGGRLNLVTCLELLRDAVYQAFLVLILVVLLRILLRREWPAAAVAALVLGAIYVLPAGAQMPMAWLWVGVCVVIVGTLALIRLGLVTVITGLFVASILWLFPITVDFDKWYSDASLFALAVVTAIAIFGAVNTRRGRPAPSAQA